MAAEAVGLAASILALAEAANILLERIKRAHCNRKRRQRLVDLVNGLIRKLNSAQSVSDLPCADYTSSQLAELRTLFESLETRRPCPQCGPTNFMNGLWGCATASKVSAKLEEAEWKLEHLQTQVLVVGGLLVLQSRQPVIFNKRVEVPPSKIGLDRCTNALRFLGRSEQQELRVIGIHGQGGLGKTTLLNVLWNEAASKPPFSERAFVQVGNNPTEQSLCGLQSDILEQLGGEEKLVFPSLDFGKKRLSEHFHVLRSSNKPMFLAIDNVWDAEDLEKLLPSHELSSNNHLPASSCIVLTCRDFRVVKALLNHFHLQEDNVSQAFLFTPPCLGYEASQALFAESALMSTSDHVELLEVLAPLCGGLPYALTILGKIFVDESKRGKKEWEAIAKQMREAEYSDDDEFSQDALGPVMKSLRRTYEALSPTQKAAFLDVVSFFYGWPWETVERIVGRNTLMELKSRALISEVESYGKCNRDALRLGFYQESLGFSSAMLVTMHELALKFGERLHSHYVIRNDMDVLSELQNYSKLKHFKLQCQSSHSLEISQRLKMATSLQMLLLESNDSGTFVEAGQEHSDASSAAFYRGNRLRYLSLCRWESGQFILSNMLSSEIREIHLVDCPDIVQLPELALTKLERLMLRNCPRLQNFSKACVKGWCNLKQLQALGCSNITEIPDEFGSLPNLSAVTFQNCEALQNFPSLANRNGPHYLCLQSLQLNAIPTISCPLVTMDLRSIPIAALNVEGATWECLQELSLRGCRELTELPGSMCSYARSLGVLHLWSCDKLEQLPDDIGNLQSLRVLRIRDCGSLKRLPPGIVKVVYLEELEVTYCQEFLELPKEIGRLTFLVRLKVIGCWELKRLPPSIGQCTALQTMTAMVAGDDGLPEELEQLGSCLKSLHLSLTSCTEMPRAICRLVQLQRLHLSIDNSDLLKELPEELGNLALLREFEFSCSSLLTLADTLGKLSCLRVLKLDCAELNRLPESLSNMSSLEKLEFHLCAKLYRLPSSLCNMASLKELHFYSCESLRELPEHLGRLTSLTHLRVTSCRTLQTLPKSIFCDASHLEELSCWGCEILYVEELEGLLGTLKCLKYLDLRGTRIILTREVQASLATHRKINVNGGEPDSPFPSYWAESSSSITEVWGRQASWEPVVEEIDASSDTCINRDQD